MSRYTSVVAAGYPFITCIFDQSFPLTTSYSPRVKVGLNLKGPVCCSVHVDSSIQGKGIRYVMQARERHDCTESVTKPFAAEHLKHVEIRSMWKMY